MGRTNTPPDLLPGTLDLLILRTLATGPKHGYGIAERLRQVSEDVLQVGESSLYPALQRLLLNGWVKAEWGASENNRRARYYTVTACRHASASAPNARSSSGWSSPSSGFCRRVDEREIRGVRRQDMRTLFRRITYWIARRSREADLAEELECHRALTQARLERSGLPATEARYASRRALGNVTLAREDARSVWVWPWLDSVRKDLAYALRALRRNPVFSAAVVLVTALGIGATTSVFGLVDALILKPLPVRDPYRLVYLNSPSFSYPIFPETRQRGGGHLLELLRVEPRVRQHRLERTARAGGSPDGVRRLLLDARR